MVPNLFIKPGFHYRLPIAIGMQWLKFMQSLSAVPSMRALVRKDFGKYSR